MSRLAPTEIRLDEYGDETHESWILIQAGRAQTTGQRLFDSELNHRHYIFVTVRRCTRKRDLKTDWLHGTETLMSFKMSEAQWGAFVSSFGDGQGVPATLEFDQDGPVAPAPFESRLEVSAKEVHDASEEGLEEIQKSYEAVQAAFESGGKAKLREAIRDLGIRLNNAPKNMEFAAKSLTEHVENVVVKARADIEAMAVAAANTGDRTLGGGDVADRLLEGPGK